MLSIHEKDIKIEIDKKGLTAFIECVRIFTQLVANFVYDDSAAQYSYDRVRRSKEFHWHYQLHCIAEVISFGSKPICS